MRNLILTFPVAAILFGCSSGTSNSTNDNFCTTHPDAIFTPQLGNQLIESWGNNLIKYSPNSGYTDTYVGAAYFTGAQYFQDSVLEPTVSPITRVGAQSIYDYFTGFLHKNPVMTNIPVESASTNGTCGFGVINGYYDFALTPPGESTSIVNARYTFGFVYARESANVVVTVESGPESGTVITSTIPAGSWHVLLQNSGLLPN